MKMSKQGQINYLTARVNQLENQLSAARLLIAIFVPCKCGHHKSDHDQHGDHACGQCDCKKFNP